MKTGMTAGHGAPASEEMRRLVHILGAEPGRVVEFIAARPGEGTSTVAREFAVAVAAETGTAAQVLELGRWDRDAMPQLSVAGQPALPAGKAATGTAVALRGKLAEMAAAKPGAAGLARDESFWNELRAGGAAVVDAPSLQTSFDGVVVAARADVVAIVVEAEATRAALVETLRRTLEAAGATVAGLVMTKRRLHIPDRVYRLL